MDRGAWQATVHGVAELDMTEWLSRHTQYVTNTFTSSMQTIWTSSGGGGGGGTKRMILSTTWPQHIIIEKAQIQEIVLVWVLRLDRNSKLDVCASWVASIVSDSPWPYGPYPGFSVHGILHARMLEWVSMLSLQGIFLTQGSNLQLLCLPQWQAESLLLSHLGSWQWNVTQP